MRYIYLYYMAEPAPSFAHRDPAVYGIASGCYRIVSKDDTEFCYPLALYRVVAQNEPHRGHQVDEDAWDSG